LNRGDSHQVLLRPGGRRSPWAGAVAGEPVTLVMAHNKTLAAQLIRSSRFFPENAPEQP
jgi:excinuclease UvrABC helicase subunit UvrB